MSFPFFKQLDSMDCGPACLRMVAAFYRSLLPAQELRERMQIGKEGVSLLGIAETAETIGFRANAVRVDLATLVKDAPLPAILHWQQNHFVVLYKVRRNRFYIADPAKGLLQLTSSEMQQGWIYEQGSTNANGIALLLQATAQLGQASTGDKATPLSGAAIFRYLLPYRKLLFQLLIGLLVASTIQLILPLLTQSIVDTGINYQNIDFIYVVLIGQFALFMGRLAVEFVRGWILLHISSRININILTDFLIKLMKLPLAFFDSKRTGDILQRMNDHHRIQSFLTGSSLTVLFSVINLVVFSISLVIFDRHIFFIFLLASFLYAVWVILFLRVRRRLDHKKFDTASREQAMSIQLVQGMQDIKLNGAERSIRWAWERIQCELFALNMKGLSYNQWQQAGALFINEGKNILITFLAAKAVIDGNMTLGAMLATQYIIGQLNSPIEQIIGFAQGWQDAKISMERLNEIHGMEDEDAANHWSQLRLPPLAQRRVHGGKNENLYDNAVVNETIPPVPGHLNAVHRDVSRSMQSATDRSICLHNVSYTYPGAGNEPVLQHLDLCIPGGKTTAIVGASGSGKTTLLKLLLKFYPPQAGKITLNNRSFATISHREWRQHCAVVMQESFIFSDSIMRNIAVGDDAIDGERLAMAAHIANLDELIEALPLGYQTRIGAEGTGISMGQRQRILIARAVYRNPDFIFFDEATNSLDANNESEIVHKLHDFFRGRTVVVVAHRLSTVRHADQIIVLSNGGILEQGKHEELVFLKGAYYQLIKNQLELETI